jgi:hypothetical protein
MRVPTGPAIAGVTSCTQSVAGEPTPPLRVSTSPIEYADPAINDEVGAADDEEDVEAVDDVEAEILTAETLTIRSKRAS